MKTPSITVVIPAFNSEQTIARTLSSVLAQTLPPAEIIVVDDGSSDHTSDVVLQFGSVVKLHRQSNSGPGAARNRGISLATGEWIALVDADDAWFPMKLARQAEWLNDDYDFIHCHATNTSEAMRACGDPTLAELWNQNAFVTSSVVVRKSIIVAAGGFNEDRRLIGVEDYNLWLSLVANGMRVRCVPEVLVDYTPAENNLSSRIEHILSAELENVAQLEDIVGIPIADVRAKQAALYDEYATALFHARNLPAARKCYRNGLRHHLRSRLALGWLATFVPAPVLNLKRRLLTPDS